MGATANSFPFAAGSGAAVVMGRGLARVAAEAQLEKAGERTHLSF
jgi:hypothetical protein